MQKSVTPSQILTRSQVQKKNKGAKTPPTTCTCSHPQTAPTTQINIMNEEQQEMFKTLFTDMSKAPREDIAKESHT